MIKVKNVSLNFGSVAALTDVCFDIEPGGITAILGENGAGKTSLFDLLLGRRQANVGDIQIFDYTPGHAQIKCRVSAMLQQASLHENLTVKEHITLHQSYYPAPLAIDTIIHTAGIESLASRRFDRLSGGEKQRVMFALAITGDPDILILDEPTVAMDTRSRDLFWRTLNEFKKSGKTILLSTHYLAEADKVADNIIVLDKGRIVAHTTPSELKLLQFQKQIRFQYDGGINVITDILEPQHEVIQDDGHFLISCAKPEAILGQLLAAVNIRELTVTSTSLEQAVLSCVTQHAQQNN